MQTISQLLARIKAHPDIAQAGMILCHNGIVREYDRQGRGVTGLRVFVDHGVLDRIITENRRKPGIVDIQVDIAEGQDLAVGDDVMMLAVAGDVRENVIAVLEATLNAIKESATTKEQFYRE